MRHFGQTNFPVAPRAQIRSAKTAAAEGLCNISALAPTTSPCAMLPAIFSVDAGVSEIPAWSFLDAIPMATRCGALDAVALADFSTAKTNAIAPQCVGGIGLQGALAQKGMTVVAENPIEAAEVQLAILKVLRSARVRSRCKFGGRTSRLAHNANPPRKALALSPLRQCGGGV